MSTPSTSQPPGPGYTPSLFRRSLVQSVHAFLGSCLSNQVPIRPWTPGQGALSSDGIPAETWVEARLLHVTESLSPDGACSGVAVWQFTVITPAGARRDDGDLLAAEAIADTLVAALRTSSIPLFAPFSGTPSEPIGHAPARVVESVHLPGHQQDRHLHHRAVALTVHLFLSLPSSQSNPAE